MYKRWQCCRGPLKVRSSQEHISSELVFWRRSILLEYVTTGRPVWWNLIYTSKCLHFGWPGLHYRRPVWFQSTLGMILEFEWVTLGWSKMVAFQQSGCETVTYSIYSFALCLMDGWTDISASGVDFLTENVKLSYVGDKVIWWCCDGQQQWPCIRVTTRGR